MVLKLGKLSSDLRRMRSFHVGLFILAELFPMNAHVYSTADLLNGASLAWCGIGSGLEARKVELGFEEDAEFPSWTFHFGRAFSNECKLCRGSDFEGCRNA